MDRIPVWLRRSLGIGIGLGVTAFAGFLAFHGIDWHALLTSIEEASLLYLFLGTLFHFLAYFCMGRRWRTELHGSSELSNTDAIASVSGSIFLNNYFPLRIGDVIRCGLMARKLERSRIGILSVLLVERLVDLAVVLCFAMVTFPLLLAGSNADLGYLYGVVGFTAITIAGLVLVHNPHTRDLILGIAQGILPNLLSGPVCGLINRVADGLQNFRSPSVVIRIAFWTICIWLCILLGNYMWILAFHFSIPFGGLLLLVAMLNLATILPSSPGGIGLYHQVAVWSLAAWVPIKEQALAFGTVTHGLIALQALALGVFVLVYEGSSFRSLTREAIAEK